MGLIPPFIDRSKRILYLLPIMHRKRNRIISLVIAGILAVSVLLSTEIGLAGTSFPVPVIKPVAGDVPIPRYKPHNDTGKALKQTVSVHPLPQEKPGIQSKKAFKKSDYLSSTERKLYKEIFELQAKGDIQAADRKIEKLDNGILMGHILAQRYLHPTATRAKFSDLRDWLKNYNDHPQAARIYKLSDRRKPDNFKGTLHQPSATSSINGALGVVSKKGKRYKSSKARTAAQNKEVSALTRKVRNHIQDYEPTQALNLLDSHPARPYIDNVEFDQLRALISAGYLYAGNLDKALQYSSAAMNRSGQYAPMAGWVTGLVQWQRGNYKTAARAFEVAAVSSYSSGWLISASGYWASRAHMRSGNVKVVSHWLRLSASYPRTFYGLIATRALGQNYDFNWSVPSVSRAQIQKIEKTDAGLRAKALIEVGKIELAEAELKTLYNKKDTKILAALLSYAHEYQLPALMMRLGHAMKKPDGALYDSALYPVIPWEPDGGYKLDKALIHAFIRQESQFNTAVESRTGAIGLMQLMPTTASYIAGNSIYKNKEGRYYLKNPRTNIKIGQKYIKSLLNHKVVGQDLMSLAIAYNAGPGRLAQWKSERGHIKDPLMFIETIPYAETRAFVERVMSNYWIYRLQMDQPTPSLDAVAEGRWARYAAMDRGVRLAGK